MDGGGGVDTVSVLASTDFTAGVAFTRVETLSIAASQTATLNATQLGAFTTITGGALSVLRISVAPGGSVTVPALSLTGAGLLLSGSTGAETLAGGTGAETLSGGAGADSLLGGGGSDVFVYGAAGEAVAGEIVDGGTGTNTLALNASLDVTGVDFRNLQGVSLASGVTGILSGAQVTGKAWSVTGVAGGAAETLQVNADAGALVNLAGFGPVLNAGILLNGGAGAETLVGSGAGDTLSGGAGADSLSGGGGDDIFIYAAQSELAAGEALDGGEGNNTLLVNVAIDASGVGLAGLDVISLASGTGLVLDGAQASGQGWIVNGVAGGPAETLTVNAAVGGAVNLSQLGGVNNVALVLNGAAGAETLVGSLVADTITGGAGADSLSGGAGADVFVYAGAGDIAAGESVNGDSGGNILLFNGDLDFTGVAIANISALALGSGVSATVSGAQASGQSWTVSGVAGGAVETLTVAAALDSAVDLTYLGAVTNAALVLAGAAGAETLTGSAAVETLSGGAGGDLLTGRGGADIFVFGVTDSSLSPATADRVADFVSGADKLSLGLAGNAAAGTGNYVESATVLADFAAALASANTALAALNATAGGAAARLYAFRSDADNGYLFVDTDSDGDADQVIVLAGVTAATFAATDIVA